MEACDQTTINFNQDQANLYLKLVDEEYIEFQDSFISEENAKTVEEMKAAMVERLDACCDSIWVAYGYVLSLNPPDLTEYEKIMLLMGKDTTYIKITSEDITQSYKDLKKAIEENVDVIFKHVEYVWNVTRYAIDQGWNLSGAFAEVTRSNMAKVDDETGKVIKREDGKILKPADWTPPDLASFV